MLRIGMIEDECSLRITMEEFFKKDKDLDLLFSCDSLNSFYKINNYKEKVPDFIILDLNLPFVSGLDIIRLLKNEYPYTKIIILTGDSSDESIYSALLQGSDGYLLKPISISTLKDNFNLISSGGSAISPYVAKRLINKLQINSMINKYYTNTILTKRETEVINEILKGSTYKEIANELNISFNTVNDHIKKIYEKLNVNSKTELVLKLDFKITRI